MIGLGSFASGTPNVPQTGMYKLHAGEAVIPADQTGDTGGSVTHNYFNVTAMDTKSFSEFLQRNKGAVVKVVDGNLRDGGGHCVTR